MKRLFIVGAPRSGTTWLQILFAQHPKIVTSSETHIYTQYLTLLQNRWEHEISRSRGGHKVSGLTQIIDESIFFDATKLFAERIYAEIATRKPNATILLDKTPENLLHIDHIIRHFPNAYFIHITRDPRSVAASFKTAARNWWGWTQAGPLSIADRWKRDILAGRAISQHTSNYLEIRYEDLMLNGHSLLSQLYNFVQEPLSEMECQDIYERCSIDNLQQAGDSKLVQPWEISAEPKGFFREGSTDGWKKDLSAYEVFSIESETKHFYPMGALQPAYLRSAAQYHGAKAIMKLTLLLLRATQSIEWRLQAFSKKL